MKLSDQKLIPGPIDGYKMLNENMTCNPNGNKFQFQMGINELLGDKALELCGWGFHFCPQPSGVWSYYSTGRLFKIRAYDILEQAFEPGTNYKMVCAKIDILEEVFVGGDRNTGNRNTGNRNTGDRNTGNRNCGSFHSGFFNTGGAPLFIFGKVAKISRVDIDWSLFSKLGALLAQDEDFDPAPFLSIPNATTAKIKTLHKAFVGARKIKEK